MAVVLEALASNLSNVLAKMARKEVGMLLGISDKIDSLRVRLDGLKEFLADAERRRITDLHVQGWVKELKDAMYDATDILELCQLKAMDQDSRRSNNPSLLSLRNPLNAHHIGSRIMALNQRLDGIKQRAEQFSFIKLDRYGDCSRTAQGHGLRRTTPELDRSGVVGNKIEQDTRRLVELLTREEEEASAASISSNVRVVAIVGVGGIGKTTLAQNIFNHQDIKEKFDKIIWLSINQEFSDPELVRTAITGAGGEHSGHQQLSLLQPILREAISGKKIFLVMDDMWSVHAWNNSLRIPLVNSAAQGSWVLITTRDERVAREMKAIQPYHRVDILSWQDAWLLLKKQVVSTLKDEYAIEKLKSTGFRILERCGGLPIAMKAIAGLLSHKEINEIEWGKVLRSPSWSVDGMPEEINHAIYLSYDDLAPHLKQCLLYCSLIPSYHKLKSHLIVEIWISEGFVNGKSNELEELGKEYFNELIIRNLIHEMPYSEFGMHDVVRSFCQHLAKDEALSSHMGQLRVSDLDSKRYRWLCIENELDWSALQEQNSVRTLFLYGRTEIKFKANDLCSKFSNLRVLSILYAQHGSFDSLCQLKNLRHLYFFRTDIRSLPDGIDKMKFLEFIGITRCEKIQQLPGSIIKLERLRCLNLMSSNIRSIPRGFGRLTSLRTLYSFPAQMGSSSSKDEWCSLEELGPLSQLRDLHIKGLENVSASSSAAKAMLGAKKHLAIWWLECTDRQRDDGFLKEEGIISIDEQRRIKEVFDELCPSYCLEQLYIRGYFGWQLPKWMTSKASVRLDRLTSLKLDGLPCCTKLPDGLCQLSCLKLLQVRRAPAIERIGHEFLQIQQHNGDCHPSRAAVAFPILETLEFTVVLELEEWVWEEHIQAMPLLHELTLDRCKLRQLPLGLASHARALKVLKLFMVHNLKSLQNLPSVVELHLYENPDMESIRGVPKLQVLSINYCPKLKLLEGIPALQKLYLLDFSMKTLPGYLQDVKPKSLVLDCSLPLLGNISMGASCSDWDKISHIQQISGYAGEMRIRRRWCVFYTREPFKLDTNIVCSSISRDKTTLPPTDLAGLRRLLATASLW
uniref:Uncharacterized protein n=4 Tax=Oryza TaxID=4527 RepID=A0A0E0J7V2_ORYNI